jgi:predicted ATPase/DNA-binding CsgD family transcriptional regulator
MAQAAHPGREPSPARSSLTAPLSSFIGREQEIEAIAALLRQDGVRLVTLTGPGGVGKTRLAQRVAQNIAADYAGGARMVDLTPIRDPGLVLRTIAHALGVRPARDASLLEGLARSLEETPHLLVLDNFEQVIEAAPRVTEILTACPRLTVLVTSRERLRVAGERVFPVPPLGLPGAAAVHDPTDSAAVALFLERARAVAPSFTVSQENVGAIAEVCRRLDGLPLAIELAAARVGVLSPRMLLDRIDRRLPLLTAGSRDAPARQQTIRDTIAWSYDLLTPEEQALFRRLAVFVGGFTLEAVDWVMNESSGSANQTTPSAIDTFDGITRLADKGLVQHGMGPNGAARFSLLETIREYGLERLEASGETAETRQRHATWCLSFLADVKLGYERPLRPGEFERVDAELPNIRAALTWLDETNQGTLLLQLADAHGWSWYLRGLFSEGRYWQERALSLAPEEPTRERARVLVNAGLFADILGFGEIARTYLNQGVALARHLKDALIEGSGELLLGTAAEDSGDYDRAEAHFTAARTLFGDTTNSWAPIAVAYHLGVVAYGRGDLGQARKLLEEAIAAGRAADDVLIPSWSKTYLALIYIKEGNVPLAADVLREKAAELSNHALQHNWSMALLVIGVLGATCDLAVPAARILALAEMYEKNTVVAMPERADYVRSVEKVRDALGEIAFAQTWATGQSMGTEETNADIQAILAAAAPESPERDSAALLTTREREVLALIVGGLSNTEIGDRLYISSRTAQTHVTNILGKLGVTTRTEAAAKAVRDSLV